MKENFRDAIFRAFYESPLNNKKTVFSPKTPLSETREDVEDRPSVTNLKFEPADDAPQNHESAPVGDPDEPTFDDVIVYEATKEQIDRWHNATYHISLFHMLKEYQLEECGKNRAANEYFRVGFDEKRLFATFAISDTRYLAIPIKGFYPGRPVDQEQADRVISKINQLRQAHHYFENFCGIQVECFRNSFCKITV